MLDILIEVVQDLRDTGTPEELSQIEGMSPEMDILMEEWNDLISAVNGRMLVGRQSLCCLRWHNFHQTPQELPLKSDGLPELRKACRELALAFQQVPSDVLNSANIFEMVHLAYEELEWTFKEKLPETYAAMEHDEDLPRKGEAQFVDVFCD